MATPEKHGLAKQFTRLIVLSGLASFLLLGFLQVVLNKGLRLYFDQPEVQQQASQRQVDELQTYIDENKLSSTDIKKLTDWTRSHRYNLLELYRDQKLIYSSYAPRRYYKNDDPEAPELTDSHKHGPFYDWSPVYTLNFSDGEITALLYYNGFDACYSTGCDLLFVLCLASFPLFFLWGSRGIVKYIVQLSEEIQAMEGGDLDHPITVQGSDELTTLASSLDSMRLTLRQQHEDEAAAAAQLAEWHVTPLRWEQILHAKHEFTHLRWRMTGYLLTAAGEGETDWLWADAAARQQRAIPSAFQVFTAALDGSTAEE